MQAQTHANKQQSGPIFDLRLVSKARSADVHTQAHAQAHSNAAANASAAAMQQQLNLQLMPNHQAMMQAVGLGPATGSSSSVVGGAVGADPMSSASVVALGLGGHLDVSPASPDHNGNVDISDAA